MTKIKHLALVLMCVGVSSVFMSCSDGISSDIDEIASMSDSELISDADLKLKGRGNKHSDHHGHHSDDDHCDDESHDHDGDGDCDEDSDSHYKSDDDDDSDSGSQTVGYNTGTGTLDRATIPGATNIYSVLTYSLWAGQSSYAGLLVAGNDDDNIILAIDTDESADIGDLHVYIWNDESEIPSSRPAPGQAPYKAEGINADTYAMNIPVSSLTCGQTYYISAHLALIDNATDETPDDTGTGTGVDDTRNKNRGGKSHRGSDRDKGRKGHDHGDDDDCGDDGDDEFTEEVTPNGNETAYAGSDSFTNAAGAWWGYFEYTVTCANNQF